MSEGRILTFGGIGYLIPHLVESCARALRQLGCVVDVVRLPAEMGDDEDYIRRRIIDFHPDFIFTVNCVGCLPNVFASEGVPFVNWFVDNPFYFLSSDYVSPLNVTLIWDRAYIDELREYGIERVYFLPLATDPWIFRRTDLKPYHLRRFACDVSFVGNSCWDDGAMLNLLRGEYREVALEAYRNDEVPDLSRIVLRRGFQEFLRMREWGKGRARTIESLGRRWPIHIYGDDGWKKALGGSEGVFFRGYVDYRWELPILYRASKINLNISKPQSITSVNQRVFDVPACGGFLLTDYREDLDRFFEVGREVMAYRDPGELPDLVERYLAHPDERERITEAGMRRVLENHTYLHRMKELLAMMGDYK
ncbi:MAG: CgeB family protein [bacterium]